MGSSKRTKKKARGGKAGQSVPKLDPNTPVPARSLAQLCGVDLKTVHQWAVTGLIPHFRTPGRHLRFRPEDVANFLQHSGHPGVAEAVGQKVVLVACARRNRRKYASALRDCEVHWADNAYEALVDAARRRFDAALVDAEQLEGTDGNAYLKALQRAAGEARLVLIGARRAPRLPALQGASDIQAAVEALST